MRLRHWRDQLIARVMAGGAPTTCELGVALAVITAMPLALTASLGGIVGKINVLKLYIDIPLLQCRVTIMKPFSGS